MDWTNIDPPWDPARPSILSRIAAADRTGSPAPLDPPVDGKIGYAAGAKDALFGGAADDLALTVRSLAQAIGGACRCPTNASVADLYRLATDVRAIDAADPLTTAVESESLPVTSLFDLGRGLCEAPDVEPVKLGIILLGLAGSANARDLLLTLGGHDEFTLFAAVALLRVSPTPERDIWHLAQAARGWGRILLREAGGGRAGRSERLRPPRRPALSVRGST